MFGLTPAHTCIWRTEQLHDGVICPFRVQNTLSGDWMSHQNRHPLPGVVEGQGVKHLKYQVLPGGQPHRHAVRASANQSEAVSPGCVHQGCLVRTLRLVQDFICVDTLGRNVQRCLDATGSIYSLFWVKTLILSDRVSRDDAVAPLCWLPGGEYLAKRAVVFERILLAFRLMGA